MPEGSTNPYLQETRIVEEFLKGIEPKYNQAVARLVSGQVDADCVYVLSGFIALTCPLS
jgi:hypothetical protein